MSVEPSQVLSALADFKDPETGRSVTQQQQVHDVQVSGDRLSLSLALSTHSAPLWQETQSQCAKLLRERAYRNLPRSTFG